jgi:hypothetical protein
LPRAVGAVLIGAGLFLSGATAQADVRAQQVASNAPALRQVDELDGLVSAALEAGVKEPRSSGANGKAGVLGAQQAEIAAATLHRIDAPTRAALAAPIKGAASVSERALILKAIAARSAALSGAAGADKDAALREISRFAVAIHGMPRAELMQKTSLLDIDETTDAASFDPELLDAPADRPAYNGKENDGLFQSFENSCGPTSIEVLKGELDPIFAFAVRARDLGPTPEADDFQRWVLVTYGEDPSSRLAPYYRKQLDHAITQAQLPAESAKALRDYLAGGSPSSASNAAIAELRRTQNGFPSEAVVRTLWSDVKTDPARRYHRIGLDNIQKLLNQQVGKPLGVDYQQVSIYAEAGHRLSDKEIDQASPIFVRVQLDRVAGSLSRGVGVMFSTTWPDHFWSMSAVSGTGAERRFLVHDVWSGITKWVDQSELVDGSFARRFLGDKKIYTRIDLFYRP